MNCETAVFKTENFITIHKLNKFLKIKNKKFEINK